MARQYQPKRFFRWRDVVTLEGGRLPIDADELRGLVDKPGQQPSAQRYLPSIARRESRRLDTQKHYQSWQKAYRDLKHKHADKSDVWCSQQIAKSEIANGRNAATIRKHMKR